MTQGTVPRVPEAVVEALARGETQSLLVELDEQVVRAGVPEAFPPLEIRASAEGDQQLVEARAAAYDQYKSAVLSASGASGVELREAYRYLPVMRVEVKSLDGLSQLLGRVEVLRLHEDRPRQALTDANLALIDQPAAVAKGFAGQGTTVAVIDTGANYTLPAFGSCTAPGVPANSCRVVFEAAVVAGGSLDPVGHGTNVSAIVAEVAPAAKLAVWNVFRGQYAYDSDILSAINWCVQNRATYNIVAMNLSLGSGDYTSPCSQDPLASSIAAARSAGILAAVAAGNDGALNALSSPACVPGAVSVGAVYAASYGGIAYSGCTDSVTAADQVTCFSNSAPFLTLLAPGALITAGGYTMAGTSQATPHVAGALAVLRGAFPGDTLDRTVARLQSTGSPVKDSRNGLTLPRIDLGAATSGATPCSYQIDQTALTYASPASSQVLHVTTGSGCAWTVSTAASWLTLSTKSGTGSGSVVVTAAANLGVARSAAVAVATGSVAVRQAADSTPPTGSIAIDGGQKYTNRTAVTLTLSASDPAGVSQMCLSNGSTCTAWLTFAPSVAYTLPATPGSAVVRAWFKDPVGNVSQAYPASIVLDQAPPVGGVLSASPAKGSLALVWSGFTDALSGVASYRLVFATGSVPSSCATGTLLYSGAGGSFTHAGLASGTTYFYRVCATDGAGNTSAGVTVSAKPK